MPDLQEQIRSLDHDWQTCLRPCIQDGSLNKLEAFLARERANGKIIFPFDTFRSLAILNFFLTKVVILGQDPYHGEENGIPQADGLAFSVKSEIKPPPSLKNIFYELRREYPKEFPINKKINPCLESWAHQGVLLLNTVLSVEKMNPGSHRSIGWKCFTDTIIKTLTKKCPHLVFLLWGNYAKEKEAIINKYNKNKQHLILFAPHPSPLSSYRGFIGCDHFKQTNQFLINKNLSPINWHSIVDSN